MAAIACNFLAISMITDLNGRARLVSECFHFLF
jgi:hypothetical protein